MIKLNIVATLLLLCHVLILPFHFQVVVIRNREKILQGFSRTMTVLLIFPSRKWLVSGGRQSKANRPFRPNSAARQGASNVNHGLTNDTHHSFNVALNDVKILPPAITRKIMILLQTHPDGLSQAGLIQAYEEKYKQNLTEQMASFGVLDLHPSLEIRHKGIQRRLGMSGEPIFIRTAAPIRKPSRASNQAAKAASKLGSAVSTQDSAPSLRLRAPIKSRNLQQISKTSGEEVSAESSPETLDLAASQIKQGDLKSTADVAHGKPSKVDALSLTSSSSAGKIVDILVDGVRLKQANWILQPEQGDIVRTASAAWARAFLAAQSSKRIVPTSADEIRLLRSSMPHDTGQLLSEIFDRRDWKGAAFLFTIADLDRLWLCALPPLLQSFGKLFLQAGKQEPAQAMKTCTKMLWLLFHFTLIPGRMLTQSSASPASPVDEMQFCPTRQWIASDFISLPLDETRDRFVLVSRCSLSNLTNQTADKTADEKSFEQAKWWFHLQCKGWQISRDYWNQSSQSEASGLQTSAPAADSERSKVTSKISTSPTKKPAVAVEALQSENHLHPAVQRSKNQTSYVAQARSTRPKVSHTHKKQEPNSRNATKQGLPAEVADSLNETKQREGGLLNAPAQSGSVEGNFVGLPGRDQCIVIDGCNVAWYFSGSTGFCTEGLAICLEWFQARGYQKILAFVPQSYAQVPSNSSWRTRVADDLPKLLDLRKRGLVQFTPAGSDDDAFIIQYAYNNDGYIVSNDNYREFKRAAQEEWMQDWLNRRKIFYTFVNRDFIPTGGILFVRTREKFTPLPPDPPKRLLRFLHTITLLAMLISAYSRPQSDSPKSF